MTDSLALLILLLLPCTASLLLGVIPVRLHGLARIITLLALLGQLAIAAALFARFDASLPSGNPEFNLILIPSLGLNLHLALDGLNIYLLMLCVLLFPVALGCAWSTALAGSRLYLALLLLLESGLLGTFLSQNLMLFFIYWEAVLLPMFVMILVFGGEQRRRAALSFFLYTLAGSVLLLAAVILLGVESLRQTGRWSFEFSTLYGLELSWETQLFVCGALVLACAIKCPLFPFHSWLPAAYCEAPASAAALMAGVLSKMGAYGLLKLVLPLTPLVSAVVAPYLVVLAVISILYGALLALRQEDFKRLVAYSSLSHMGYIVLGIFSFQQTALHGALFQMLSHGVAVAGLFLLLDLLEQRVGPSYRQLSGLSSVAPRLAVVLMLLVLTTVALPLTSGFTSEFLILFGAFQQGLDLWHNDSGAMQLTAAVLASAGMVLGAGYMLRFARSILFGVNSGLPACRDLRLREAAAFAPLLMLIILLGVWPFTVLDKSRIAVAWLADSVVQRPGLTHTAASTTPKPGDSHGR